MIFAEIDSHSSAYAAGHATGQIVMVLLLLLGILKSISISRRETTNFKCVLALILFLIGSLIASASSAWLRPNPDLRIVFGLASLLVMGFLLSAMILAIIGLVEYSSQPGRFQQGRAQAIWTLSLCGVFLLLAGAGAVQAIRKASTGRLEQQPSAKQPLVFEDLNFQLSAPGRPWNQLDAQKVNASAKLAFLRARPEVFFIIIPERIGGAGLTTESLADIAVAHVESTGESVRIVKRIPSKAGRLNGLRVETEARVNGYDIFFVHWFYATNGWSYQLMTWGRRENKETVVEEANQWTDRFEMIDPERRAPVAGQSVASDFVSTNYHYRVRCAGSQWINWQKLDTDCAYASFGVMHQEGAMLVVSAIHLMGLEARPDLLYRGILDVAGLFSGADSLVNAKPIQEKNLEGVETTLVREVDGKEYTYRLKVLQGGGFAYLVAAWVESSHPKKEALLRDAFSCVEFLDGYGARPDPARMDAREKRAHRMLLNSVGLAYYNEEQYEQSAQFFKTVVGLDGLQKGTPYLQNLVQAYSLEGKFRDALDALDLHPDYVATQPELQAKRAFLQGKAGSIELALTNYAKLFASGYNREDSFEDYVNLLSQNEQPAKALKEIEAHLKRQDTPSVRLSQARFLKQLKKYDDAVVLLKGQHEKNPFHLGITYSLGDAYILIGQANDALALSDELLKKQGGSLTAWYLKGRAEYALKWYREARTSFEHAAKESPADTDVQDYLQAVSSALGEGSSAGIKDSITPVPVPAELMAAPTAPGDFGREEGAHYFRSIHAVSFKKGTEMKQTDYLSVKILTPAGVSAFSTFQFGFSPMTEELFVNQLQIKNALGSLISTGRIADYYVLDERNNSSVSTRKVLNIPVSGLQPGCTIELIVTRRALGTPDEFTFVSHSFSRSYPVIESVLYLTGDTQAVRFASSPRLEPQSLREGLCWRKKQPLVVRWEPYLPTPSDYVPRVWLGDASARWADLVTNYLETIRERFNLPDEQREITRKLTVHSTNAVQKVKAIAAYIQTNYTYKAIEFGRRARVPEMTADIVRNRYGDCKDHSLLAQQMLSAAGVPASLALVSFDSAIREDVPSLDQFDHMIVHIAKPGGDMFLDCTEKGAKLGELWTTGLAGCNALVLDERKPRFVRVPEYPTNASHIGIKRAIQFTNQTDAVVNETVKLEGVHAGYLRDYFARASAASRHSYVVEQFITGSSELLDLTIKGLDEPQQPLELRLIYRLRGQFHSMQNQIVGSLPLGCERAYLAEEQMAKRTLPFEMAIPLAIDCTVTVAPPSGYKAKPSDASAHKIANSFVTCESVSEAHDKSWRFSFHLYRRAGRLGSEEYANHCRALQEAIHQFEPRLVYKRIAS